MYFGACLLVPSFIPFTFAAMLPAYKGLQDAAAERIKDETHIRRVFDEWGRLNAVRGWLIACGAFVGVWASLK